MAEEKQKKVTKGMKIRARLAQGWRDAVKISEDTGAKLNTVKFQMHKFYKANPDKKPAKVKKEKVVKPAKEE